MLENTDFPAKTKIFVENWVFSWITFFVLVDTPARSMLSKKTHIFSESSKSKLSNAYLTKLIAWKITEIQAKPSKVIHQKSMKMRV